MYCFRILVIVTALFLLDSSQAFAGTAYYVSPSGHDSNNGLSSTTPWLTLTKVSAGIFSPDDSINLDAGNGPFYGCLNLTGYQIHTTVGHPLVIQPYNGARWAIYSTCGAAGNVETAAIIVDSVQGLTVQNGYLNGNSGVAPTSHAIFVRSWDTRVTNGNAGLLFHDLETVDFNTTATNLYSAHFMVSGISKGVAGITIRNVKMHGLTATAHDDNGIAGYGNGQNITGVSYLNNEIYNIGGRSGALQNAGVTGNGIWINGTAPVSGTVLALGTGAVIAHNYVHDISANVAGCGGTVGIGTYNSSGAWIQGNEIARVAPTAWVAGDCDFAGIDIDGASQDTLVEGNYTHHNAGPGWETAPVAQPWNFNIFRNNISVNDGSLGGTANAFNPASAGGFVSHNNTIYVGLNQTNGNFVNCYTTGYNAAYIAGSSVIANNICINLASLWGGWSDYVSDQWQTNTNPSALVLLNNDYQGSTTWGNLFGPWLVGGANNYYWSLSSFNSASGKEAGSMVIAPQLQSPGTEPTCFGATLPCPSGYQVHAGAPVVGTGVNLSQPPYNLPLPATDYFGNPFTLWNIGADGSAPASSPLIGLDTYNSSAPWVTFYYVNAPANSQIILVNVTSRVAVSGFAIAASGSHAAMTVSIAGAAAGSYVLQLQNAANGAFYAQTVPFSVSPRN